MVVFSETQPFVGQPENSGQDLSGSGQQPQRRIQGNFQPHNQATWQLFNSLLIIRLCLKHMIQRLPTNEQGLPLDPSPTTEGVSFVDPLASLVRSAGSGGGGEVLTQEALMGVALESPIVGVQTSQLLSWRLVEGLNLILADIPLLPFTYDIHQEAVTTLIVLLSGQMFGCRQHNAILNHIMSTSTQLEHEDMTLLLYMLLQKNSNMTSYIFSKSDLDLLVDLIRRLNKLGYSESVQTRAVLEVPLPSEQGSSEGGATAKPRPDGGGRQEVGAMAKEGEEASKDYLERSPQSILNSADEELEQAKKFVAKLAKKHPVATSSTTPAVATVSVRSPPPEGYNRPTEELPRPDSKNRVSRPTTDSEHEKRDKLESTMFEL
eukprot:Em0010g155a